MSPVQFLLTLLRVELRGNFEFNAGTKDILLNRIKVTKEKLCIAYGETSS